MKKPAFVGMLAAIAVLMLAGCGEGGRPPNEVNEVGDIDGRPIGAIYGTPSARLAEEHGDAVTFESDSELAAGLSEGLVDCAVMDRAAAEELTAAHSGFRVLGEALLEYDLCFAVPRENAQLLEAVNSALAALRENGTLLGLTGKYLSGKSYEYMPPEDNPADIGDLRLAISANSPPYAFKDENGEITGLDVEVARAVCDYLEVGLSLIEVDTGALVTAVWFGQTDIAAGWLPDDAGERVNVSDAYADIALVVLVRT